MVHAGSSKRCGRGGNPRLHPGLGSHLRCSAGASGRAGEHTRRRPREPRQRSSSGGGGSGGGSSASSSGDESEESGGGAPDLPSDWQARRSKSWDGHLQDTNSMGDSLPLVGCFLAWLAGQGACPRAGPGQCRGVAGCAGWVAERVLGACPPAPQLPSSYRWCLLASLPLPSLPALANRSSCAATTAAAAPATSCRTQYRPWGSWPRRYCPVPSQPLAWTST